jgi:hypothetical protein
LTIFQHREGLKDKLLPLVAQRLLANITMPSYGITDVPSQIGRHFCQLDGDGSKELVSFGKITSTSRKEETCPKTALIVT